MQQDQTKKKSKKVIGPEKIVEKEILAACKEIGLDVSVVDSGMEFTKSGGQKMSDTEVGFSDLVGNTENGIAVFIELKARGKIANVSPTQLRFLLRKAQAGCFACAVDRPEVLFSLYLAWKAEGRKALERHLLAI